MSLGYDVYDDERDFVQDGLTGSVRRYATEDMQFPCMIVAIDEEHQVEGYKLQVLRSMQKSLVGSNSSELDSTISVYFDNGSKLVHFGKLIPKQVRPFIQLFEQNNLRGFLAKDDELTGNYLYALAE